MNNLLAAATLAISLISLPAADWPQWRGPLRDGHAAGTSWPAKLDTNHLRQTWRVELGPSYSGPVISGTRVFTTETRDKKSEAVTAYDRQSGRQCGASSGPGH